MCTIKAICVHSPLSGKTLEIPYIENLVTVKGVNQLLHFHRRTYRIPRNPFTLSEGLASADCLGDDVFTNFIAKEVLKVHPRKLTLATNLFAIVRDRYHLARIVPELIPSQSSKCQQCQEPFSSIDAKVECPTCFVPLHKVCIRRARRCPNCAMGWCSTVCIVCKKSIPGGYQQYCGNEVLFSKCCRGEIHHQCLVGLFGVDCPACEERLDSEGYPFLCTTVTQYVRCQLACRRNER